MRIPFLFLHFVFRIGPLWLMNGMEGGRWELLGVCDVIHNLNTNDDLWVTHQTRYDM